jgi:maltose O-acetyltransferase
MKFLFPILQAISLTYRVFAARKKSVIDRSTILRNPFSIDNKYAPKSVVIGAHCLCMGSFAVQQEGAGIVVGKWCYIGPNTRIWAMNHVDIGDRVFISHGVHILDNNSHSLSPTERHEMFVNLMRSPSQGRREAVISQPVKIEADVWIGFNAAILKGVTIGTGAVVGAMSVVTKDVPARSVVVGNPARIVRRDIS